MVREDHIGQAPSRAAASVPDQTWPGLLLAPHHRRTLGLVALIWFSSGTLFMLPYLLRGGLDFAAAASHYSVASVGLALSVILLAMATRLQALSGIKVFVCYALTVAVLAATLGVSVLGTGVPPATFTAMPTVALTVMTVPAATGFRATLLASLT